jgi:hypothetical protein
LPAYPTLPPPMPSCARPSSPFSTPASPWRHRRREPPSCPLSETLPRSCASRRNAPGGTTIACATKARSCKSPNRRTGATTSKSQGAGARIPRPDPRPLPRAKAPCPLPCRRHASAGGCPGCLSFGSGSRPSRPSPAGGAAAPALTAAAREPSCPPHAGTRKTPFRGTSKPDNIPLATKSGHLCVSLTGFGKLNSGFRIYPIALRCIERFAANPLAAPIFSAMRPWPVGRRSKNGRRRAVLYVPACRLAGTLRAV